MQGMTAGAQTQRFAAEADYRRQMAAMQQEAMDVARQERAMSQQERADVASIEGFFAVPGVAAPAGGMIGGPAPAAGETPSPLIQPSETLGRYVMPPEQKPKRVTAPFADTALAGAQAFASQLKTDSARAMFFNRFAQARKDELVRVEAQKTQESFSNLLMGIKENSNLAGRFDPEIEALTSMLNKLDDPDQTAESRAQILSSVTPQILAMKKAGDNEENRINRYRLTMGQYENMIAGMKVGSQEMNALTAQYSAFKNNPNAGIADIEEQQTAITNISAGRTEYSPKLKDWFTPADRMKREAEMYASSVQQNFTNLKLAEAQAQIQMFNLQAEGAAMDLEKSYAENAMKIHDMQFVTDELGSRTLGISPEQYRSPAAIEQDLRSAGARAPKVNVPSGAVGAAPAAQTAGPAAKTAGPTAGGAVDLAVEDLLGEVSGGVQKPPLPSEVFGQNVTPVDVADIEEMKSMRQRLADAGLGSKEKLADYDKRISQAESANQRYADLSKKYQGQPIELEVRRRAALNEGRTDEADEISYLIGINSQGWWANLTPGIIGWDELSGLSDEELANEYAGFKRIVKASERRRAERQAYVKARR